VGTGVGFVAYIRRGIFQSREIREESLLAPELSRRPGEWQSLDITLVGRWITVVQNGQTIIDHKQIPGITGGALDSHE